VLEGRDPRTQSGILQLSVGVGRTVTQPGQHRALIGVEIGAGRMWPIERDSEAAKPARDWNGKDGSPEAGREPGIIGIVVADIERHSLG
jgi:hypothetical protein